MARPPIAAVEPVLFDFRAPPQLTPAVRLALESIQARFAGALRGLMTPRFRQVADAAPTAIELMRLDEYAPRFGHGDVRFLVALGGAAPAQLVLQFGAPLAAHCVDRLFGGSVEPSGERIHPLTMIERTVLADFVQRMLPLLRDAASETLPLDLVDAQFVATPDAPAIVAPGQTIAVLGFEWRCGPVTGPFEIALPLALLEAPTEAAGAIGVDGARQLVEGHVRLAHVTVTARIGFRASAFDVASMQAGTVLSTGHPSHADVEISANGQRLFTGMLGRHAGHAGVRLLRETVDDASTPRSTRRTSPS